MTRVLTIIAAIAALAVSAAPASAARVNAPFTLDVAKKPPPGLLVGGSGGAGSLGRTSKAGPSKARVGGTTQLQVFSGDAYVNEMG